MDPFVVIGGGALALYLLSQNATASSASGFIPGLDVTGKPKTVVGNQLASYVGPVDTSYDTYDYEGIQCFADWRYVENALETLGYDVASVPVDNINSLVYSLSVYSWYYQLMAVGKKDDGYVFTDTGAFGVIDEKMIGWGFTKIGVGSWRYDNQRYRLNQSTYILGINAIDPATLAMIGQALVDAYNWLVENNFWDDIVAIFDKPNDIVRKYFIELGMSEPDAISISDPIYPGHGYWDSALMFTDYLIANPLFYETFTPKYK